MIFDHLKYHVTFIRRCRWKSSLYKDIKKRKQVYGIYEECNEPVNLTQEKNGNVKRFKCTTSINNCMCVFLFNDSYIIIIVEPIL